MRPSPSLKEMVDKVAYILGVDPALSLGKKMAASNKIVGVEASGTFKDQVNRVEHVLRKAANITSELGIEKGLRIYTAVGEAFKLLDQKMVGSNLREAVQELERLTGITDEPKQLNANCQKREREDDIDYEEVDKAVARYNAQCV